MSGTALPLGIELTLPSDILRSLNDLVLSKVSQLRTWITSEHDLTLNFSVCQWCARVHFVRPVCPTDRLR